MNWLLCIGLIVFFISVGKLILMNIERILKSIELRLMDFNRTDLSGVERRLSEIERAIDNISNKVKKIADIPSFN